MRSARVIVCGDRSFSAKFADAQHRATPHRCPAPWRPPVPAATAGACARCCRRDHDRRRRPPGARRSGAFLQKETGWNEIECGYIVAAFQGAHAIGLLCTGAIIHHFGTHRLRAGDQRVVHLPVPRLQPVRFGSAPDQPLQVRASRGHFIGAATD